MRSPPRFGLGGSPVTPVAELPRAGSRAPCFFGVDVELGRAAGVHNRGAATAIRGHTAGMAPWLRHLGAPAFDVGVLRGRPAAAAENVALLGKGLADAGFVPVAVGCDHTVSYWHARGVAASAGPVDYVYLDAHLDLGWHHARGRRGLHNGNFVHHLLASGAVGRVVNVGARAWSTYDGAYDRGPIRIVRGGSGRAVTRELADLAGREIYVSLDADVLDPAACANVCCPVPLGLPAADVLAILAWLARRCVVVGADLSELVPRRGVRHTSELALRLLHEAVGTTRRRARHRQGDRHAVR